MGHASAETTWNRYAHLLEEAQLASSSDPDEAIGKGRRKVSAESSVRPLCDEEPVRRLRRIG